MCLKMCRPVDVYIATFGRASELKAIWAETLRDVIDDIRVVNHCGGGTLKNK